MSQEEEIRALRKKVEQLIAVIAASSQGPIIFCCECDKIFTPEDKGEYEKKDIKEYLAGKANLVCKACSDDF